MSATPMQVLTRPFAIEPVTSIMLPDGIFDNAIYGLRITCHYTNTGREDLTNVRLYLESVSDPGIVPQPRVWAFPVIRAGATVRVGWDADFQNARPGKPFVSFVARADGFEAQRSIRQIFVSQTRFDPTTNTYNCSIEEGTIRISGMKAIGPKPDGWWQCNPDKPRCPPRPLGPFVPTGLTMVWEPNPAYAGVHGDLPFSDPWWKVLAIIVAVVAAIVAIVAAALGAGKANFSVGGTFEETDPSVSCCTPKGAASGKPEFTVAGVSSAIASGAIAVACSDDEDPFFRGQAATPPAAGDLTVAENVVADWTLPEAPTAGKPYMADVKWTYTRQTTAGSASHSVSETQTNIHVAGALQVETPPTIPAFEPLWVRMMVSKPEGNMFRGPELYAFALFQSPDGIITFVVDLTDDGLGFDDKPDDGVYAGSLDLKRAYREMLQYDAEPYGTWRIFVFAQDVNLVAPGTAPEIAAKTIGGFFVASAVEINFDPSLPCPLKAQATITVT
ncbi:hypothetical protein [Paracoccus chinensis]|uniref:Uncharacterized protein n=1 Tax=Paracoccus chinensis TaxID=525640 RepID=A0A1G9NWL8_9RHOB|nr:hypothetical protein [Paracoccus chinensis]SDL90703.1 hypothetical protein SAMN04487971_1377 [Paracoccus chinensis]